MRLYWKGTEINIEYKAPRHWNQELLSLDVLIEILMRENLIQLRSMFISIQSVVSRRKRSYASWVDQMADIIDTNVIVNSSFSSIINPTFGFRQECAQAQRMAEVNYYKCISLLPDMYSPRLPLSWKWIHNTILVNEI